MPIASFTTIWHLSDFAYASDTLASGCFQLGATGTNKTYQAAVTRTDLVLVTTTTLSSGTAFDATDVGNYIFITAGAGFTTGVRYRIVSVAAGVATLDSSAGVAGSTGGTGYLGGSMRSPGATAGAIGAATHQTVYWTGTHTTTTDTNNVAGGRITLTEGSQWIGYNTTPGDSVFGSTMLPLFTRGAFATALITTAVNAQVRNVRINAVNNATLLSNNFANVLFSRCWIDAHRISDSGGLALDFCYVNLTGEVSGNSLSGVAGTILTNCCLIMAFALGGSIVARDTVIYRNTAGDLINSAISASTRWNFSQCSLIASTGFIFNGTSVAVIRNMTFTRCILWNEDATSPDPVIRSDEEYSILLRDCAYPTAAPPTHTWNPDLLPNINPVPLAASPFTNTAGGDFSLTSTAESLLRIASAVTPGVPTVEQFGWIGFEPIAPAVTPSSGGGNIIMPPIYDYYPLTVGQVVPPAILSSAVGTVFDTAGTYVFESSEGIQHSMAFAVGFDGTIIRKLVSSAGGIPRLALGR